MRLAQAPSRVDKNGVIRSMIYGWGDEPDTADFLRVIAERVQPGMRVADIGSGTGILAIAAAELGAEVVAFEEDADCREQAQANFDLNGVTIELWGSWPESWDGLPFDLVVVNLGRIEPEMLKLLRAVVAEVYVTEQETQKGAVRLG